MTALRRIFTASSLFLALAPSPGSALDLNGKWRFGVNGEIVLFTHTGNALSYTIAGIPFSGSVTPGSPFATYAVTSGPPTAALVTGRILPSENVLDARVLSGIPPDLFASGTFARRCGCDDGNAASGDGCDACQVEPCWSCAGDPSVCMPLAENAACEDGSACTMGETCAAGVCGGGSAVSPCTDMSGNWLRRHEVPSLGLSFTAIGSFQQTGTDVVGDYVGTIDPASGAFDLRASSPYVFVACPAAFDTLIGSVSADGSTYAGTGVQQDFDPFTPEFCAGYTASEVGSRCGNGEVAGGEECDDGNRDEGDGCGASCDVEACWSCAGATSLCAPAPRAPCTVSTAPRRSSLLIKDRADAVADRLVWRWKRGGEVLFATLGDPVAGDRYELCLFDESGPETRLAFAADLPGGGMCDGGPCWTPKGATGFRYARDDGAPDGAVALRLRAGDAGRSAAVFKGRGVHLSDRPGGLPTLPLTTPLRIQLRGGLDLCIESEFTAASVIVNDAAKGAFEARGAQP